MCNRVVSIGCRTVITVLPECGSSLTNAVRHSPVRAGELVDQNDTS